MAESKCTVCLVVVTFLWTSTGADPEVSCVFMERCILPCSFQGGDDVVVHWIQLKGGDVGVHSFYDNQDQLEHQDQRFRGRTSLFKDQISRGNASLLLTGVEVQDQGRYRCYTRTTSANRDSFINLKVDAPVHKVDLQQGGNRITCSSERIYPEPELTWSTTPPSEVTFNTTATVQQTEQQLYSISSSLILSDSWTDLVFSCNVSTHTNWRRTSLFKPASPIHVSDSKATIPCTDSYTSFSGLVWRFNHSHIILTKTGPDVPCTVSEKWRQHVKHVSESGSLILQDVSSHQEGIYTCELSDAEETYVTNTFLRMEETRDRVGVIIGAVVGVVVGVLTVGGAAAAFLYCRQRRGQEENSRRGEELNEGNRPRDEAEDLLNGSIQHPPNSLRHNEASSEEQDSSL